MLFDANIFDAQELVLPDSMKSYGNCIARVRGIEAENDFTSPVYGDNIFGLTGTIGNRCSWEAFICQNKDLVKTPLWYLLGSEVMSERLSSSRFSQWTTIQKDQAERSKLMYDTIYAGGTFEGITYEGVINQMIDGLNISGDDCCLECNAPIRIKENSGRY